MLGHTWRPPPKTIENQNVSFRQAGGDLWFLPTLEIIKSIGYDEFPIPPGQYLTSTRCTETGRLMVFEYNGMDEYGYGEFSINFIYPAKFNTLYKIWLVKLVKCKTHYSQNDSDYSY